MQLENKFDLSEYQRIFEAFDEKLLSAGSTARTELPARKAPVI